MKYRPDIDGLRAISVLGVLVFHYFPNLLPGGFVGVDVFFVISGFLIGGLIFDEIEKGGLDFARFYGRRIRRIFPALVLVLVGTYVAGWFILFPWEFRQLGKHLVAAALFVSNFALVQEAGYFDAAFQTKPLLHLWSLAIEEQFYILWPLYVWLTFARRRLFIALTIAICIASFALCILLDSRTVAFYIPASRFWEILSGSLLAYGVRHTRLADLGTSKWSQHLAAPGLVLIAIAFADTPTKEFPGWRTLLPVVGACLVVLAGPNGWLNSRLLSLRGVVFVGLISYPLYLWHWPLISYAWIIDGSAGFDRMHGNGPSLETKFVLIGVSFLLACLTYYFFERPIRFGPHRRIATGAVTAAILLAGGVGGWTMLRAGLPDRTVAEINMVMAVDMEIPDDTRTSDKSCVRLFGVELTGPSVCLANSPNPVVMFVGDSQAMALYSAIYRGMIDIPAVLVASHDKKAECVKQIDFNVWLKGDEPCQLAVRAMFKILKEHPSIRLVVFHYQDDGPFYSDRSKIEQLQKEFLKEDRQVVHALGEPGFGPITSCYPRKIVIMGVDLSPKAGGECKVDRQMLAHRQEHQRAYIEQMRRGNPNVRTFDWMPAICDEQYCYQAGAEGAWFWTAQHVNEKGSVRLLNEFLRWSRGALHDLQLSRTSAK